MLKFRLLFGPLNRRAGLADDDPGYAMESSSIDEMSIAQYREILDDSPTDEMEAITGDPDRIP